MAAEAENTIAGFEYDWLASDVDGYIALFSTAGSGYAPRAFLRDTHAHERAVEAVISMQATTQARFAPTVSPGLQNIWLLCAERGLFAFDCDPCGGPYRLVAAPKEPIHLSKLPKLVGSVAGELTFRGLRFSGLRQVEPELLMSE